MFRPRSQPRRLANGDLSLPETLLEPARSKRNAHFIDTPAKEQICPAFQTEGLTESSRGVERGSASDTPGTSDPFPPQSERLLVPLVPLAPLAADHPRHIPDEPRKNAAPTRGTASHWC
ncbi:MAG: hypothetical protein KF678_09575 [Phycisphaeraceae bacterium]|nr:hypothetical protein [Phycisphaeraceae bacterium]